MLNQAKRCQMASENETGGRHRLADAEQSKHHCAAMVIFSKRIVQYHEWLIRQVSLVFFAACLSACVSAPSTFTRSHESSAIPQERAALSIVARRTAAYNEHDIDAFLATYADNVRVYEYPDKFLGEGVYRMRAIFGPQFEDGQGRIVVHSQHVLGNTVVSDETVSYYGKTEHNIGIYIVDDGLIVEVRLIEPADE